MTAVQDVVTCPQCAGQALSEFQTRTLATTIFCPRCGYREEAHTIRKRKTKAGDLIYHTTKHQGFGAYLLRGHQGISEMGTLSRPLTPRVIAQFKQNLKHPEIDAGHSFLTRWNPKLRRVEMVVGKFPRHLP